MFDIFNSKPRRFKRRPLWKWEPAGWQKCPICEGKGSVPNPKFTDPRVKTKCDTCNGKKLINKLTGLPPKD